MSQTVCSNTSGENVCVVDALKTCCSRTHTHLRCSLTFSFPAQAGGPAWSDAPSPQTEPELQRRRQTEEDSSCAERSLQSGSAVTAHQRRCGATSALFMVVVVFTSQITEHIWNKLSVGWCYLHQGGLFPSVGSRFSCLKCFQRRVVGQRRTVKCVGLSQLCVLSVASRWSQNDSTRTGEATIKERLRNVLVQTTNSCGRKMYLYKCVLNNPNSRLSVCACVCHFYTFHTFLWVTHVALD